MTLLPLERTHSDADEDSLQSVFNRRLELIGRSFSSRTSRNGAGEIQFAHSRTNGIP